MMTNDTLKLTTAPLRNLSRIVVELDSYLMQKKFRWFGGARDDFSWVYGLSEVEIADLAQRYEGSVLEIKNAIDKTTHENLRDKLKVGYEDFPHLDCEEFVLDTNSTFWILKTFRPLKRFRKTLKFKAILSKIKRTCDRMINYYENVEWLDLEKEVERNGG